MLTVKTILKATQGRLEQGSDSVNINGVSIDSRSLKKGNVFIAIKGSRFDGHRFIRQVQGASVIIVSKKVACPKGPTVIRVQNTTKALGEIAAWHRCQFDIPVIAVTGSTGKTTTKEMIAGVLGSKFHVLKNVGTENNHIGVPLTLLKLKKSYTAVVVELGTNQFGDIPWLAYIAKPTVSVFTNIGEAHLRGLKDERGVLREKIKLIKAMPSHGHIVFNADNRFLKTIRGKKVSHEKLSYAINESADIKAHAVHVKNNRFIEFKVKSKKYQLKTPVRHNVANALAAIACGLIYKINYINTKEALFKLKYNDGRQTVKKVGKSWLLDDTYNANPLSFQSAIQTLDSLDTIGKKILICADMLELGSKSKQLHRKVGSVITKTSIRYVMTMGRDARYVGLGCQNANNGMQTFHFRSRGELHHKFKAIFQPGDAVLVKGSRGMRMEETVEFLRRYFQRRDNSLPAGRVSKMNCPYRQK